MRKTYLAKWQNGTISILTARNNLELFDKLDVEGDPNGVLIYRLPEDFHLGTDIQKKNEKTFISCDQQFEHDETKMKRHKFPENMTARFYADICGVTLKELLAKQEAIYATLEAAGHLE